MVIKTQWQVTLIDTTLATPGHRWVATIDGCPWKPLIDSGGHDLDRARSYVDTLLDREGLVRTTEWELGSSGHSVATVVKRNRQMSPG